MLFVCLPDFTFRILNERDIIPSQENLILIIVIMNAEVAPNLEHSSAE